MKFCICPSLRKKTSIEYIGPIAHYLKKNGASVFIDDEFSKTVNLPSIDETSHIDVFITLGGDGTLLAYGNKYLKYASSSFVGVNLGSLGFMADVRAKDFETYLQDLLEQRYAIEERTTIECKDGFGKTYHAINDIVLHRGNIKTMVHLKVTLNGEHFNTFHADGLIIATPTGSTAYSLAANGPILSPLLEALVITPVSAHALTSRPYITSIDTKIEVEYENDNHQIEVTTDGLNSFPLATGQSITIKASEKTFKLITFPSRHTFFSTLRSKLYWGA